jgi:signal transduction histidine kinase
VLFRPRNASRPAQSGSRPPITVVLLGAALVFAAVLTYQAQAAARSHRATAEGTLTDYASFAAWEFSGHARTAVLTTMITAFSRQLVAVDLNALEQSMLPPAELRAIAMREATWCECLGGVRYFFNINLRDSTFRQSGRPISEPARRWVTDTVGSYAARLARNREMRPLPYGSADGRVGEMRRLGVIVTNDSYVTLVDEVDGESRLLAFVISRDYEGEPVAVFGFESDPEAFLQPIFDRLVSGSELLPRSLVRTAANDSVLSVQVSDIDGHQIYHSRASFRPVFTASDTLEQSFGRFVVRVAIRPDMANELIVGGLPSSRLPMLIALFTLTAGLVVVALLQFRRQQELARLRTDFVSGVSHELRTPLAHIRLFAELLQRGQLNSEEQRHRSARVIDQEARRLTFLVENVLNFSRGERNAQHLTLDRIDLATEIRDVIDSFQPLAQARHVTVRSDLPPRLSAMADRGALRQILLNLLDNAVKYGPAGQTVRVGGAREDDAVRIWVDDEGPGVPEEYRRRILQPYYRLERDAESAIGGSGIGLAVVDELVQMHDGRIIVEDAPSGGARFLIELPIPATATAEWPVQQSAQTAAPAPAQPAGAQGRAAKAPVVGSSPLAGGNA